MPYRRVRTSEEHVYQHHLSYTSPVPKYKTYLGDEFDPNIRLISQYSPILDNKRKKVEIKLDG